jgi:hypothetical protein
MLPVYTQHVQSTEEKTIQDPEGRHGTALIVIGKVSSVCVPAPPGVFLPVELATLTETLLYTSSTVPRPVAARILPWRCTACNSTQF